MQHKQVFEGDGLGACRVVGRKRPAASEGCKANHRKIKRARCDITLAFASTIDGIQWDQNDSDPCRTTSWKDMMDLDILIYAISSGNMRRAANAIIRYLNMTRNEDLRGIVLAGIHSSRSLSLHERIVEGIKESIEHHTNGPGTRTVAAETFVKNVVAASVFSISKDKISVGTAKLAKCLGTSNSQLEKARTRAVQRS